VARDGEAAAKREHYDMTTLVRKPLRSKHCSKTHFTVCRFDHYCVWTGNAIGGGNHRPFVLYCIFQVVSQIIVAYTTFSVLFTYAPLDAHHTFDGPLSYIHWMFNVENTLITTLWWIDTVLMFSSYAKAVLADPGAVQSSAEMRQAIIENVARDGEAAAKREHYDMTNLLRKPLRSKHCSKTHFTVCREQHGAPA
jgi:hypothetical protein